MARQTDRLRRAISVSSVWAAVGIALLLPLVLDVGRTYLFSEICIYAVIALSLTILTGWAGQLSLGQFGLVAVGSLMAAHLGNSVPLPLLLLFGGAVTAAVAIVIGLPALRMPGLFLAVSTLGFAYFMQQSVLPTACWTLPVVHKTLCTGLPAGSQVIARPELFGVSLASERAFAYFSLAVLVLSVLAVRTWRDHGVARRLVAVRDNEITAAGHGHPGVADEAARLRALGLHGRLRRGVLRVRHPAPEHRHLRPDGLVSSSSPWSSSAVSAPSPERSSAPSTSRAFRRSSGPTRRSSS